MKLPIMLAVIIFAARPSRAPKAQGLPMHVLFGNPKSCALRIICTDSIRRRGRGNRSRALHRARSTTSCRSRGADRAPRRPRDSQATKAETTATAHKNAVIFYAMVKNQVEYDETIWATRDEARERTLEAKLKRQANQLGYQLIPIEQRLPHNRLVHEP